MLLIDDHSCMMCVTFLKEKSEALEKFKAFKYLVENGKCLKIMCLHLDNEGEFISNDKFIIFCESMQLRDNILLLEYLNKMVLLRGRIDQSKRWHKV